MYQQKSLYIFLLDIIVKGKATKEIFQLFLTCFNWSAYVNGGYSWNLTYLLEFLQRYCLLIAVALLVLTFKYFIYHIFFISYLFEFFSVTVHKNIVRFKQIALDWLDIFCLWLSVEFFIPSGIFFLKFILTEVDIIQSNETKKKNITTKETDALKVVKSNIRGIFDENMTTDNAEEEE